MTAPQWHDDDALLAELREALLSAGPVTDDVRDSAKGLYAWRSIDEDLFLLSLSFDSLVDDGELVRSSTTQPRILVFSAAELSVELEVAGSRLLGQVIPASPCEIIVQTPDRTETPVQADDLGIFTIDARPAGPYRLRVARHGRPVATTDWITTT